MADANGDVTGHFRFVSRETGSTPDAAVTTREIGDGKNKPRMTMLTTVLSPHMALQ